MDDSLDEANPSASLADGVLTVSIPKHAKAKSVKIQIGKGSESEAAEGIIWSPPGSRIELNVER